MKETFLHYVAVEWVHTALDEPVYLYYELDVNRYERRKVEVYRDGRQHYADSTHGKGTTFLSWGPHPPLEEINSNPEFRAHEISAQDFENVWSQTQHSRLQLASST